MAILVPVQRTAFRTTIAGRRILDHVPVQTTYNIRGDWFSVSVDDDEICIGLLREKRHAGIDIAPTMIAPSRFRHDTCLTWYQTGNPYQMEQLGAYFLKIDGPNSSVDLRHINIVEELIAEVSVEYKRWPAYEQGMLPEIYMPQQRWIVGSLTRIQGWLENYEATRRPTAIKARFIEPLDVKEKVLYLTEAIGTDWVKFGKAAGRSALVRLRQAQLCSPYRLRQLGVWLPLDGNADHSERHLEAELKKRATAKRWEWVQLDKKIAVEVADHLFGMRRCLE